MRRLPSGLVSAGQYRLLVHAPGRRRESNKGGGDYFSAGAPRRALFQGPEIRDSRIIAVTVPLPSNLNYYNVHRSPCHVHCALTVLEMNEFPPRSLELAESRGRNSNSLTGFRGVVYQRIWHGDSQGGPYGLQRSRGAPAGSDRSARRRQTSEKSTKCKHFIIFHVHCKPTAVAPWRRLK